MGKIIVFLGSPRKSGFSTQLVDEVIRGAKSKGAEVIVYDLNSEELRGCQACGFCRSNEGCSVKDLLEPVYAQLKEADGFVFSSPIYMGDITGQAKLALDRMYPLIDSQFKPRYPGKKTATVITYANPSPDAYKQAVDALQGFFKTGGCEITGTIVCSGTGIPDYKIPESMLKDAYTLGEALVK